MSTGTLCNVSAAGQTAKNAAAYAGESSAPRIRHATAADIPALADIHATGMPHDFMVRLGRIFQTKVLFPTMIEAPGSCIYVADDGSRVLGFLITRRGFGGLISDLLIYNPAWFFLSGIGAVLCHPNLVRRIPPILNQLRVRGSEPATDQSAELFLTAVADYARGRGIGLALVKHSIDQLRTAGVGTYRVLMHAENEQANRLYAKTGFNDTRICDFSGQLWRERSMRMSPQVVQDGDTDARSDSSRKG